MVDLLLPTVFRIYRTWHFWVGNKIHGLVGVVFGSGHFLNQTSYIDQISVLIIPFSEANTKQPSEMVLMKIYGDESPPMRGVSVMTMVMISSSREGSFPDTTALPDL